MNVRFLISGLMTLVGLGAAWAVIAQRQELGHLRIERHAQLTALSQDTTPQAPSEAKPAETVSTPAQADTSPELLQLRNEVTRLTQRKQALGNVQKENEQLRMKLASRATNAAPGALLPPGFMRKSQAQMVGYNSPQDTLQSLLWGMQHHDFNSVVQAFTPEAAQNMQAQFQQSGRSTDDFFRDTTALVGLALVEQKQLPDGSIEGEVQFGPSNAAPQSVVFRQVNGQWKVAGPF